MHEQTNAQVYAQMSQRLNEQWPACVGFHVAPHILLQMQVHKAKCAGTDKALTVVPLQLPSLCLCTWSVY